MIFLSAQPDDYFFLWQLQLLIFNLNSLGVQREKLHILVGYNPKIGLRNEFKNLIVTNKQATFYCYPDDRTSKTYSASIRPHLISKHVRQYPELENEIIFYHDSDIVLKCLPDFDSLIKDDIWYVSNTRSYLGVDSITTKIGEDGFYEMCEVVGISPEVVEANDQHAGGAQYIIKNSKLKYWTKVEADCEILYQLLNSYNRRKKRSFCGGENNPNKIQAWCADMWAIWWNALLLDRVFRITNTLDFCWADSPIDRWHKSNILHYTGCISKDNKKLFNKANFSNYPPFHENMENIDSQTCSYPLKQIIQAYSEKQLEYRINLPDVSFLIPIRIQSTDILENIYIISKYLSLWFQTNIIILEVGTKSKMKNSRLSKDIQYHFVYDENVKVNYKRCISKMISKTSSPFICIYEPNVVLPITQISEAVQILREGNHAIVSPFNGISSQVDSLMKSIFAKVYDPMFFEANQNKCLKTLGDSFKGPIFFNKELIPDRMSDRILNLSQSNYTERSKRLEISGNRIKRISGNLYHLSGDGESNNTDGAEN